MDKLVRIASRLLICLLCAACSAFPSRTPQVITVEVERVVRETVVVTAPPPPPQTVEVTRIVERTVVVTPTAARPENVVTRGASLPYPRASHTVTRLNDGKILFVGGSRSPDEVLAAVELFDPASGVFKSAAPLRTARRQHTATLLGDGRVLVIGGISSTEEWLADAEFYTPSTNQWTVTRPVNPHGAAHTATLLRDGRVLVAGGCLSLKTCTDQVEIFNPIDNSWTEVMPLPAELGGHTANQLEDGWVLVAGGESPSGPYPGADALLYDPKSNAWAATGPMRDPRREHAALKLPDGRVLVAGGLANGVEPVPPTLATAEIYDPYSNTWASAGQLSQGRYGFALTGAPGGGVLALGGASTHSCCWGAWSFVKAVELYNPAANRWQAVGEIDPAPAYAFALPLADGRVWLTGGRGADRFYDRTWLISSR